MGTLLFARFLTTLDYGEGRVVFQENSASSGPVRGDHEIPFWMAGDHLMLAQGRANDSDACLMFVDTGLAGGGFTCPASTIEAARVDLSSAPSFEGVGGGGTIAVKPFVLEKLSLGTFSRQRVTSFFGPFPESLEHKLGFRIGGLVSHAFFRGCAVTFDFSRMRLLIDE